MAFNFLLFNQSFQQHQHSKSKICKNIEQLFLLKDTLNKYKENLLRDNEIYSIQIYEKKAIYEVLYDSTLDGDYKVMLRNIIDKATDYTEEIQIDGYIGLNIIEEEHLIYSVNDWFLYHYRDLDNNFSDERKFYNGLTKYFPNLEFHENIKNTLKTIECQYFARDIIKSLICLDNFLKKDIKQANGLPEALKLIKSRLGLNVTLEGKISRKKDFSFIFKTTDGEEINVYCEPHVKLEASSNPSDSMYYQHRIYFHQGFDNIKNNKILIGYIGKHL